MSDDTLGRLPGGLGSGPVSETEAYNAMVEDLKLRVARAWRISSEVIARAEDVEASVEPFEGSESSGFVARSKVRGIKLSEVAVDRDAAMAKLVDAARVRGQMERER